MGHAHAREKIILGRLCCRRHDFVVSGVVRLLPTFALIETLFDYAVFAPMLATLPAGDDRVLLSALTGSFEYV